MAMSQTLLDLSTEPMSGHRRHVCLSWPDQ
jgi:hypothetical protein